MRSLLKSLYKKLPLFLKKSFLILTENFYRARMLRLEKDLVKTKLQEVPKKTKKRVLIYHLTALYYAGTEKSLQIIAEALSEKYDVFILHASDLSKPNRSGEVEKYATLIQFSYSSIDQRYPHYIVGMNPHIKDVIESYGIDLLITAGTGKAEYPFITIQNIPVILLNIFGAPCLQNNIEKVIYISQEVLKHSVAYTGNMKKNQILYIPVSTKQTKEGVESLRKKLGISEDAFIFGRIGRGSDSIFDPIGINAFKELVRKDSSVHYVIISPPPALEKIVAEEKIPNVHFLPPTAKEEEIWSFYYGIDSLAHFRFDGETQGLNICESMYARKPIITHISHIWNAHLEYLDPSFARITKQNDDKAYLAYMEEFVALKKDNKVEWEAMCESAKRQADNFFSKKKYQEDVRRIVTDILA